MFSVRLVTADSYQATPLPQLDPTFSEFRGAGIKHVPIIRVFGTTPTGEKTCLHLHGVFPYLYVPYTGEENADSITYRLAASLDTAINISLGSANSNTQHVYQIQRVAGIPFYGYHRKEHQFLKISFYNPAIMNKAIDLLHNGSVLNQTLQPHEAHIPYILQFMIDYNIHGMSFINLDNVKHRAARHFDSKSSSKSPDDLDYLPSNIQRQSICQLEVDAHVSDILNRKDLERGIELNPGLAAIWEEERARRAQAGLPNDDSQLVNPKSPTRPQYHPTYSDLYHAQRLSRRLETILQSGESSLSTIGNKSLYPAEVPEGSQLLNASNLGNITVQNLDRSQELSEPDAFKPLSLSQESRTSELTHNSSTLDAGDLRLVEVLMEMAQESANQECVDDDSVLGTQSSTLDLEDKSDNEEEEAADLNLTCYELDSFGPWDYAQNLSPSHSLSVDNLAVNNGVPQTSYKDALSEETVDNRENLEDERIPQFDGAGDLSSSFLESDEEENSNGWQERMQCIPDNSGFEVKSQSILSTNLPCSVNEAFIVDELLTPSKSQKNSSRPLFNDGTWSSFLSNGAGLEQYPMNFDTLGSDFENDFENVADMSVLLPAGDELSTSANSTGEEESIPLETVLNGDPCFTQTAEMDKSDFAELQDLYVSLVDSELVPDVYKDYTDNDTASNLTVKFDTKEKSCGDVTKNSTTLRLSCNRSSSENVTPNIQEPETRMCKNKLNQLVVNGFVEPCKDSKLASDNSDYNCNVVATWEELQDLQFIPERIHKSKQVLGRGKQVLTQCSNLSYSMIRRKRGRPAKTNKKSGEGFRGEKIKEEPPDSSCNLLSDDLSLDKDENSEKFIPCERVVAPPVNNGCATVRFPIELWKKQRLECSLESKTSKMMSDSIFDDVQELLPDVQCSPYLGCEIDSPVLSELIHSDTYSNENTFSNDNCSQKSYYSSERSHNRRLYAKSLHRHCRYSPYRRILTANFIFTSDQIWVIEKRTRGSMCPLSSEECTKNCRLPFVPLVKINIEPNRSSAESRSLLNSSNGFASVKPTCNPCKIVLNKNPNKNVDSLQSNVSIGRNCEKSENNHCLKNTKHNSESIENSLPQETSTQSSHISSTQNHDTFEMTKDKGVIIKRFFEDTSYNGTRSRRAIILKIGSQNNGSINNLVSLSSPKASPTHEDSMENAVQAPVVRKKRGRPRKSENSVAENVQAQTEIPEASLLVNAESKISSSQIESFNKRPQLWCSIQLSRINLNGMKINHRSAINGLRKLQAVASTEDSKNIEQKHPNKISNATVEVSSEKNQISTESECQQFHNLDDSSLNGRLCDSIYPDNEVANIFNDTENIEKSTAIISDHENLSDEFTSAMTEASLFTGKNYTIDAISQEIPHCLFEEDSNSESSPRKVIYSERLSIDETTPEACAESQTIDDNPADSHANVSPSIVDALSDQEASTSPIIRADSPSNAPEISSINTESSPSRTFTKIRELIAEESVNADDKCSESSRSQSPELDGIFTYPSENMLIDEEIITNLMKKNLVLDEKTEEIDNPNSINYFPFDQDVEFHPDVVDTTEDSQSSISQDDSPSNSSPNYTNNNNLPCSEYSPKKISILRKIYMSTSRTTTSTIVNLNSDSVDVPSESISADGSETHDSVDDAQQLEEVSLQDEVFCGENNSCTLENEPQRIVQLNPDKMAEIPLKIPVINIIRCDLSLPPPEAAKTPAMDECHESCGEIDAAPGCANKVISAESTEINNDHLPAEVRHPLQHCIARKESITAAESEYAKIYPDADNPVLDESNNNQIILRSDIYESKEANKVDNVIVALGELEYEQEITNTDVENVVVCETSQSCQVSTVKETHETSNEGFITEEPSVTDNQYCELVKPTQQNNLNEQLDARSIIEDTSLFNQLENPVTLFVDTLGISEVEIEIDDSQTISRDDSLIKCFEEPIENLENSADKFPTTVCREFSIVLEKLSENQLNKYMGIKSDHQVTTANLSPKHSEVSKKSRMNKSVKFDEEVFIFEYNKRVRLRDEDEEETALSDDDFEEVPEEEIIEVDDDQETEEDGDAGDEASQDEDLSDVSNEDTSSSFDTSPVFINVDDLPDTDEDPIILDESPDIRENCDKIVDVPENSDKLVINENVYINEEVPDTLFGSGEMASTASEEIYVDYEYLSEEIDELPETSAFNPVSTEFQTTSALINPVFMYHGAILPATGVQLIHETIENHEGINSTEIAGETGSLVAIKCSSNPRFIVLTPTEAADDIVVTQVPIQHRPNGAATLLDRGMNEKSLVVNPFARNKANNGNKCAQSNGFIRVTRTVTPYYEKTQTINVSPRMSYNRVTTRLPKYMRKSKKERFLAGTGLYNKKPRISRWHPSQTTTGFIQIQQPHVVLQRLSPSTLKYYGYTRRFKSNRYGKSFNSESNRCSIPAFDGAADGLTSSDSDSEVSASPESAETRACRYRATKRRMEQVVTTPKKRVYDSDDNDDAECQVQKKRCVLVTAETPTKIPFSSPNRRSMLRSPGLAGRYSPLKINIMTSPKVQKVAPIDCHKVPDVECIRDALCVTPRRRKALQHRNLTQHRVSILSAGQSESVLPPAMTSEKYLGELNILNKTTDNTPGSRTAQLAEDNSHHCKTQDIGSRVKDISIRKKLFSSTDRLNAIFSRLPPAPDNQRPSTSKGHSEAGQNHDPNIASEEEEDLQSTGSDDTINPEQTSGDDPRDSPAMSSNHEDDNDIMNVTFTDYINSQMAKQPASLNERPRASDNFVRIVPTFNPPTAQRVIDTMEQYNISTCTHVKPHFSNQADVPIEKELAHRILKVPGTGLTDLPVFKCSLDDITGLNRWRKMKVNEFHPSRNALSKAKSMRQSLAGHNYVIIKPLLSPPSIDSVRKWLRARDYLKKQEERQQLQLDNETLAKKSNDIVEDLEKSLNASNSSVVEQSPEINVQIKSRALNYPSKAGMAKKILLLKPINAETVEKHPEFKTAHENSSDSSVFSSSGEPPASLLSILGKSRLFKDNDASKYLGVSCGQIDCATMTNRGDANDENMQKVKALTQHQFITVLCVEVHVETREDLLPDPQHDSISAIFYAIQNDVPTTSLIKPLQHGVIAVANEKSKLGYLNGSNVPFSVTLVASEEELFTSFIDVVTQNDPEIFIGWEIECLSWGYIFQRASKLGLNLSKRISRIPDNNCKWDTPNPDAETLAEVKLPGRIVLDIWRIMKSEVALLTYTFENVFYHVMNERLSCPSFNSLTSSWQSMKTRWKVVQHYSTKVLGILRMLEQLDIIGRTSEHARLFGIQFYEVFSRGSQYRVESIMLRLAKPLNYIPVSPSSQQRACMRAMEALPLIMEPESIFYSDPVIVLDFQSLYPSIIIAHNYCFSTCLGRIEHIGQPEPFEFGATVLQVTKNTALQLQNKINYSPCGVAFVKPEVRQGILPRMLTEILETRFMVKKAMKDHSKDDKLLQRVLHSRQHGLKYLANVTYGYTAANFSGRMPCIELGDSVISKSKETLERAIKLVETTPKWGARVVYGDTDSLFILVAGKSKDDAFKIGNEIADAVTASNLSPIKLRFEKVLYPSILQTKKRYCGYMYETPDQKEPTFLAKGIETVRRDGCPGVSKILTKTLKILFDTKDMSLVKKYVVRQLEKILNGKVSLEDLTFAKEFRGMKGYKERACVPALELTRRLMKKDPRAVPRRSERVRYVIVAGAPNEALIHCVRSPWEVINDPGLRPNGIYYVTRVIIPPINRCLNLMGVDVNTWYREMPHRYVLDNPVALPSDKQKQTIFQYFGTIVCTACGRPSNRGICSECTENPSTTLVLLHDKLRWLDRTYSHVTSICQSCVGRGDVADCVSLDCPVLYRRAQAQRKLSQACEFRRIIEEGCKHEF